MKRSPRYTQRNKTKSDTKFIKDIKRYPQTSVRWVVRSILHGVDPLSYFSFQPVHHDWCNKGYGMCYPVCGMVHIKESLLLIGKSRQCGGSGFPISLSEWSFTICPMPYNRKQNVLSASLNKTFPLVRVTSLDCTMAKSLANGLVGSGFASWYRLQLRAGL